MYGAVMLIIILIIHRRVLFFSLHLLVLYKCVYILYLFGYLMHRKLEMSIDDIRMNKWMDGMNEMDVRVSVMNKLFQDDAVADDN